VVVVDVLQQHRDGGRLGRTDPDLQRAVVAREHHGMALAGAPDIGDLHLEGQLELLP